MLCLNSDMIQVLTVNQYSRVNQATLLNALIVFYMSNCRCALLFSLFPDSCIPEVNNCSKWIWNCYTASSCKYHWLWWETSNDRV